MSNCLGNKIYIDHKGLFVSSFHGKSHSMSLPVWQKGKLNDKLLKEAIIKVVKTHGDEYLKLMRGEFSFAFDKKLKDDDEDKVYDAGEYLASTMHLYKFYDELNIKYDKEEFKRINRIANRKIV